MPSSPKWHMNDPEGLAEGFWRGLGKGASTSEFYEWTSSIYICVAAWGKSAPLSGILEGSWKKSDLLCKTISALLYKANELKGREQEKAKKCCREAPLLTTCPSSLLKGYLGRRIIFTTQTWGLHHPTLLFFVSLLHFSLSWWFRSY